MKIDQYKTFLKSLGIDLVGNSIDEDVADVKTKLLERYYKIATKIAGHTTTDCGLDILINKTRAIIFVKTVSPYEEGDFGVIFYRRACDNDMDDAFFKRPLSHKHRIEVFCKPEEVIARCEEIFNSECDVTVGADEYEGWMEFKQWEDTTIPPIGEEGINALLGQLYERSQRPAQDAAANVDEYTDEVNG